MYTIGGLGPHIGRLSVDKRPIVNRYVAIKCQSSIGSLTDYISPRRNKLTKSERLCRYSDLVIFLVQCYCY